MTCARPGRRVFRFPSAPTRRGVTGAVAVLGLLGAGAVAAACARTGGGAPTAGGAPTSASTGAPVSSTATTAGEAAGPATTAAGTTSTAASSRCRSGNPLADVYHPDRLTVLAACMTVGGTVMSVRSEQDGDTHFDLALDARWSGLLKPANFSAQHGWLVVEIVPADKPGCVPGQPPRPAHGSYDYGVCTGAAESDPPIGSHVYVTGPYVVDEDHGGWAEIHPVWAMSTTPPG